MECIVIVGIMKNATKKGLIAFDFGSFVKSKDLTLCLPSSPTLWKRIRSILFSIVREEHGD
jgi:hypothetical protein